MLIGINVKTINDEVYNLEVEHDSTISNVKTLLKESTSIPEDRQRLIYKGRVLQDHSVIEDYHIEDGHTIHMVARPSDFEEVRRRQEQSPATSSTSALGSGIGNLLFGPRGGSSTMNINQSTSQTTAASSLQTLLALSALSGDSMSLLGSGGPVAGPVVSEGESLEAIRQGLLTAHTFFSTMHSDPPSSLHGNAFEKENYEEKVDSDEQRQQGRRVPNFFVGQWLDVKDTVNQWLEATVMDIDYLTQKVFVHYNGWPPRWDEWIDFASDRITPFRTRTTNITLSQASPFPSNPVSSAPVTGPNDIRHLLPELTRLVRSMLPLLEEAAVLCTESRELEQLSPDDESTYASGMPWQLPSSSSMVESSRDKRKFSAKKYENDEKEGKGDKKDDTGVRLASVSRDLAPLLDRLGRAMTDSAPHLLNLETAAQQQQQQDIPPTQTETEPGTSSNSQGVGPQQHHTSSIERMLESLSLGVSPLQRLNNRSASTSSSESSRNLLVTSPVRPRGMGDARGGAGGHLDIHIHAIMAPMRPSASSLLAGERDSSSLTVTPETSPPLSSVEINSSSLASSLSVETNSSSYASSLSTVMTASSETLREQREISSNNNADGDNVNNNLRHDECDIPDPFSVTKKCSDVIGKVEEHCEGSDHASSMKAGAHVTKGRQEDNSESCNQSIRDDIEEMYDTNFGEHFRRLRMDTSIDGSDKRSEKSEVGKSVVGAAHSSNSVSSGGGGVRECVEDSVPSDSLFLREKSVPTDQCKADYSSSKNRDYIASTMPSTYSQYSKKKNKSKSLRSNQTDVVTTSSIEREVALLSGKIDQSEQGGGAEIDDEERRRKSLSFVQRVRRSLSFQQSKKSSNPIENKRNFSSK